MEQSDARPMGLQSDPVVPAESKPDPQKQADDVIIKTWTGRFQKAEKFLEAYFERDQQAYEFWYMWREFRGPYRSNIFPPDVHAGIESVVPRLTKGRPKPVVKGGASIPSEVVRRIQRAHDGYWDIMDMDDKWETLTKRGAWFGFGVEKITWRTTGKEEPVTQERPIADPQSGEVIGNERVPVMIGERMPDGQLVQKPKTRFVADYNAPFSEIMDPARVYFPRGYAREEDLPWVLFQYFKKNSECEGRYDEAKLKELRDSGATSTKDDTLDRDKVHRLPRMSQVLGQETTTDNLHEQDASNIDTDDDKDDPTHEIWEIYTRPTGKHPKGQKLAIGNRKVVLKGEDNDMPEGELPLVVFAYIEDTFNLRGVGLAREMERLVLERADKRNQRMDNVSNAIDSMAFLQENEKAEDSEFMHRPNGIIRLADMANYKPREVREVTQNAYREDEVIVQDIARATGANELVIGAGKRTAETLGEADILASSSNERYDGVIRRLERALNRHARLVHLLVRQNGIDGQRLEWTDRDGSFQEESLKLEDFRAVNPRRLKYDAKSVIAYKELSRKQGLQLLEVVGKLLGEDPMRLMAMMPIISPLLELYDEVKINPAELVEKITSYAQTRLNMPPPGAPPGPDVMPVGGPAEESVPDQSQTLASVTKI